MLKMAQRIRTTTLTVSIILTYFCILSLAEPERSLVTRSTDDQNEEKQSDATKVNVIPPKIYQMHVKCNIKNRFAHTTIISKVMNMEMVGKETIFSVVLPETAYISGFIMEIGGKNYTAYVKEKEEAKKIYEEAVSRGVAAGHVAVSARNSNRFTISVHIEAESKAAFYLTYEELLQRQSGYYELVINLHPGQPVKDLSAEVLINENRKIARLKTPPLRSGNEIGNDNPDLDPRASWSLINNDTSAVILFNPNVERQKQLSVLLGGVDNQNGFGGQFVVQYDVERDPNGGEVLINDGYFVHFFAPTNLLPLPKHVVFILDTSGSMVYQRIKQLKEAMHKILEELHEQDLFNVIEFNSKVRVWSLDADSNSLELEPSDDDFQFAELKFPDSYSANSHNIQQAKKVVSEFQAEGGTNIFAALRIGLHLTSLKFDNNINRQPMIMFLTDGEATVGLTDSQRIVQKVTESNSIQSPIFTLSFGDGADRNFLEKLAYNNFGFAKHIYEGADASLQLQNFYRQISSPLLSNVTFQYDPSTNNNLTRTKFPIHFNGSELVVAGWCDDDRKLKPFAVEAWNGQKFVSFEPTVKSAVSTSMERLWAYLTIKQILEKRSVTDVANEREELKAKALTLALKYSFVTPISSLVVVKPNKTDHLQLDAANKLPSYVDYNPNWSSGCEIYCLETHLIILIGVLFLMKIQFE